MISGDWDMPIAQIRLLILWLVELSGISAVALEITSHVFNDGHGITAWLNEVVIAVGFDP